MQASFRVEEFDDENAKKDIVYIEVGCKGPSTYNTCGNMEMEWVVFLTQFSLVTDV